MQRWSVAVVVVVLSLSLPAGAQPSSEIRTRVTGFSGWASPDRPLGLSIEVANAGTTPLEDVAVRLIIRERVRSRSALRAALDGKSSGQELASTTEQLDEPIAPGGKATISVQRDLGSLATSFRSGRAINGVYPMDILVRAGGHNVAERPTAFVFLASQPEAPLNLVWVMPVHRPLASDARGVYARTTIERELAVGGRIHTIIDVLSKHPTAPLTLVPSGLFVDQLLDLSNGFHARTDRGVQSVAADDPLARAAADLLDRLRAAAGAPAFELATPTYGRASIAALVSAGLAADAVRQVESGRERMTTVLGRAPSTALVVDGAYTVDARSARTLATLGAKTLVVDPVSLASPVEGRFGPERVEDIRTSRNSFDGLLLDTPIRDRLELPSEDPVLSAMGVAAETAAAYLEQPALGAGRMLVVTTRSMPEPVVTAPLLDILSQAPWIQMRTASNAAANTLLRPAGESVRLDAGASSSSARFTQARGARHALETLDRILVRPSGVEETARLDRLILVSESADYSARPGTAVGLARAARERAQRILREISVQQRRVTLTSRGGRVPVTVINATGYTIRLRVRLDSQKVRFPEGASRHIQVPGRERGVSIGTIEFEARARAAGSFPVVVRLESTSGDAVGSGQIQVNSSAVSAVTFMATAGGALFLAGAWARRSWSRRRKTAPNA